MQNNIWRILAAVYILILLIKGNTNGYKSKLDRNFLLFWLLFKKLICKVATNKT